MWVGYFAGIFVLFMIALAFAGRYAILQWGGKPFGVKGTIDVTIPKGYALMETSDLLENSGAIENARAFAVYTLLSGNRGKIQAGFYRIRLPIAPKKLIEELRRGSFQTKLTIPEGWTQSQIAQILRREGWIQDPKNWSDAIAPPVGAEYFGEEIASGAE
ncbi:endolytic transglycosylase MltG, partial [Candidatus Sumerlaeota bacterium]|nr:endolytic transglycosylase MltG [Candidatus Sumerlaeota bacterium]